MIDVVMHRSVVTTMGERVRARMETLGIGFNELDRAIGQGSGYTTRLVAGKKKRPDPVILAKIAKELGVTTDWLSTGEGQSPDGTPPTPPARSGPRLSVAAQRPEIEVLGWFFETLQSLVGQRKYTAGQSHAATQFLLSYSTKLPPEGPRKVVLGALEAAKELDELGNEMTPEAILQVLLEKNAPPSGAEAGVKKHQEALEFTKDFIRKEGKKALRGGYVPKKRRPE